jgi:EAL and modified HD-GYP domain-containing signal transduction protein
MFGFIRKLFSRRAPARIKDEPARHAAAPPPVVAEVRPAPAAILQRDEIIDAATRIAGYRFAARLPEASAHAARLPEASAHAAARATLDVLTANRVAAFAERRLALIPIQGADWLTCDYRSLIGPHTAFLLDRPRQDEQDQDWRDIASSIRAAGARVAVSSTAGPGQHEPVADHADLLLLDFSAYAVPDFDRIVTNLRQQLPRLELIVEKIGSWPERRYCVSLGVAYCMGPFTTCADEEQPAGEIGQSRLVLLEMLNLLRRDADPVEIAKLAKRDPGVSVKLVAMANSALAALAQPATSVEQAIVLLGREQLYRWLSIAVFRTASGSPRDKVLLELALSRGRFLELIAQGSHDKAARDELFLLGLLSLIDVLLGVQMSALVTRLHLSAAMGDALARGNGPLEPYLMLAIAVEKGPAKNIARLAGQLAIPLADIEAATSAALAWAEEAASLND